MVSWLQGWRFLTLVHGMPLSAHLVCTSSNHPSASVARICCSWQLQMRTVLPACPWLLTPAAMCLTPQLCFAVMAISSHPALEHIPPLVYSTLRIVIALPLLLLSARLQVCETDFPLC